MNSYQDVSKKENRRNFQNSYNSDANKDSLSYRNELDTKFKTEICRNWETGDCEYGEKCFFAHGPKDLREKPGPKVQKLQKCENFFKNGYCINGNKCLYKHSDNSDNTTMSPSKKSQESYKAQEKLSVPIFIDLECRILIRS